MNAKNTRRIKSAQANRRQDAAALIKLVTNTVQQIKIGRPLVMVATVVDMRGNALAALMIKGPPPPPLRDLMAFINFVTANARQITAGLSLVMFVTVVDTRNNGLGFMMVKGPPPPPL
jgi:hypothetical protein